MCHSIVKSTSFKLEITSKPITNTVKTNTRPRRQKYSMYVNHKSVSHTKSDLPTLKWLL